MHLRCGLILQITDDFIAAYQAQYGVQEFSDAGNDTTGAVASTGAVAMSTEVSSVFQRCRCYHRVSGCIAAFDSTVHDHRNVLTIKNRPIQVEQ